MGDTHWPLPTQYEGGSTMYVAFCRETLTVIGVGDYKTLWMKAVAEYDSGVITIGPVDADTTYLSFTEMELKILHRNMVGDEHPAQTAEVLVRAVKGHVQGLEPVARPHTHTVVVSAPVAPPKTPVAPLTPETPTRTPDKQTTRPKAGTATGRVWEVADEVYAQQPHGTVKELRQRIIEACTAQGINPSTSATQYSRWRGSKNIA